MLRAPRGIRFSIPPSFRLNHPFRTLRSNLPPYAPPSRGEALRPRDFSHRLRDAKSLVSYDRKYPLKESDLGFGQVDRHPELFDGRYTSAAVEGMTDNRASEPKAYPAVSTTDTIRFNVFSNRHMGRGKFEQTGDEKYIDKAHRRGKVGWMALVWTGSGRAVPKVVPRRGSVVHREKVEKVPSGFGA